MGGGFGFIAGTADEDYFLVLFDEGFGHCEPEPGIAACYDSAFEGEG